MEDFSKAAIPIEKFRDYSMKPDHPKNGRKHEAFLAIGYQLSSAEERESAAADVIRQLTEALAHKNYTTREISPSAYGRRTSVFVSLTGPNGRTGILETGWLLRPSTSTPELITNWLKVHRDEDP